jgi:hypothetical protein
MRNFRHDVRAAALALLRVAITLEAHVAGLAQLAEQRVDAVPSQVAALLQIVDKHLPVVRPREQVGKQTAGGPGETRVLDGGLVDDDVGHPRLRITAFQVADGVLRMVATARSGTQVFRKCTERRAD